MGQGCQECQHCQGCQDCQTGSGRYLAMLAALSAFWELRRNRFRLTASRRGGIRIRHAGGIDLMRRLLCAWCCSFSS